MPGPTAAAVLVESLTRSVGQLHSPRVPPGDTLAHRLRVASRRLRSTLRTFEPLLDPHWSTPVRTGLRDLADALGPARDAEVLLERLADHQLTGTEEIARKLRQTKDHADAAAAAYLASEPHHALLARLAEPIPFLRVAHFSAAAILPPLLAKPWQRLTSRARTIRPHDPVERWHNLRIRTKQARYALEATGFDEALTRALARCQDLLGEHQDANTAADAWRALAADPAVAEALYVREAATAGRLRKAYPRVWKRCENRELTAILDPHR
ncbi:CHAD domain-containing protein [Allocatelliglobosispora scoriae]|uniref:CHAD domain-containing protein n=1 Tax=Allocatelliglobosispora scoriae TaxID=643052 RepID=A0A841BZ31_9ACTN|nr:CHAD domain-containing protein [Allocatelliglobosispora scoriae]MBB5872173.1 CHAD domain-containing protein [Allocatelliglobosispora scoriae]